MTFTFLRSSRAKIAAIALVSSLALIGFAGQKLYIELNADQMKARELALAKFVGGKQLNGVKSFDLVVSKPDPGEEVQYDPDALRSAIKLELRRSGIRVDKGSKVALGVSITSLREKTVGGDRTGYCGFFTLDASMIGFTDGWGNAGSIELFHKGFVFSGSGDGKDQVQEPAKKSAEEFCLEWLRQNQG